MRKLYFLLFIIFLFSCEDNVDDATVPHCWDCYVKDNITDEVLLHAMYCNMSANDLRNDSSTIQSIPGKSYRICYNTKWQ